MTERGGTRLIENSRAEMQVSMSHVPDQRVAAPIRLNHTDLGLRQDQSNTQHPTPRLWSFFLSAKGFQVSLICTCGCDTALAPGKSETRQARQRLVGLRKSVLRPSLPELWHFTPHFPPRAHLTLRRFRVLDRAMLLKWRGQVIEICELINANIWVMSNRMLLCACLA